jgi:hypothetical protein|tara:strand:+ start:256 stop:360 length:105 start_codon:yes stop_codon:yes gene_type:complete
MLSQSLEMAGVFVTRPDGATLILYDGMASLKAFE